MSVELLRLRSKPRGVSHKDSSRVLFKVKQDGEMGRSFLKGDLLEVEIGCPIKYGDLVVVETAEGKLCLDRVVAQARELKLLSLMAQTVRIQGVVVGVLRNFEERITHSS